MAAYTCTKSEVFQIDKEQITVGRLNKRENYTAENRTVLTVDTNGLAQRDVESHREKFGSNTLTKKKRISFIKQLLINLNDPIIKILIGALFINAIISFRNINIPETIGIAAAIIISTLVSTVSEYSTSLAFDKLSNDTEASIVTVRRDGNISQISASDIVAGDIVLLSAGSKIHCDGYLISGRLYCNQSSLTGESTEVKKYGQIISEIYPNGLGDTVSDFSKVFAGSLIVSGSGEMVAVNVGDNTLIGKLAVNLQENSRPSPLKKRLSQLAKSISIIGYVLAALIAFAYLFNSFFIDSGMNINLILQKLKNSSFVTTELLHAITLAVSVVVVAVPEGLPMMITVVLSSNMKRMLRDGVLVKRLVGIETAGSMNVLFTDKTGTLTTGEMSVEKIIAFDKSYNSIKELKSNNKYCSEILKCIDSACNIPCTSATEKAIVTYFLGKNPKRIKSIKEPFDSDKKYSSGKIGSSYYYLGAPEKLLSMAESYLTSEMESIYVSTSEINFITEKVTKYANEGSRVLCAARKKSDEYLEFLGLIILSDPLRNGIKSTVKSAQRAGIQVIMVTGDNTYTASKIANEAGIITNSQNVVLTSSELNALSDDQLCETIPRLAVVARALPEDKIRLVKATESMGLVTGMTGDGINDSPALKSADIGFAMGSGTEIAKEASDVVITDDSFDSIINAVLYGRTIFESIRKFIVFQLIMNLCAMGVSLIGPFIGIDNPVTVIQMLWINVIMDTLGGLAFAGEPALKEYLHQKSKSLDEKILTAGMVRQILFTGGYSLLICIAFLKSSYVRGLFYGKSQMYFLTAFFALLIFCGIFNSFNARTPRINLLSHLNKNKAFVIIMTAVAIIQLAIIYFGGQVFRCIPLEKDALIISAAFALTVLPADILRKIIVKRTSRKRSFNNTFKI